MTTDSTFNMKRIDQITAIILLLFSGYIIWQSSQMPIQAQFGPGRGFLPLWLGVILAVLSIALLFEAVKRPTDQDEPSPFPDKKGVLAVVLVVVGLIAYPLMMNALGYVLTTFIFVMFLMLAVQRNSILTTLLTSAIITLIMYLIFDLALKVRLPDGPFGF